MAKSLDCTGSGSFSFTRLRLPAFDVCNLSLLYSFKMWLNRCEWSLNILHDASEKMEEWDWSGSVSGRIESQLLDLVHRFRENNFTFCLNTSWKSHKIYMSLLFGHRYFQTESLLWIYFVFIHIHCIWLECFEDSSYSWKCFIFDFLMKFTNNKYSIQINIHLNGTCLHEHFHFFGVKNRLFLHCIE